jgi:cytosine/creatinine deaminase
MNPTPLIQAAYEQALQSYQEGGLPIGAILADPEGNIIARGHNLRVQTGDPTAHAEVVCIRNAGRRRDWTSLTLISTLSPCIMCTGTALLYRIPRILIGENHNFRGPEDLFLAHHIQLTNLHHQPSLELMQQFIADHPDLWHEDIGL